MNKVKKGESTLCPNNLYSMFSRRKWPHSFYLFEFEQNVRNRAMLYIQNIQPGDKTVERFFTLSFF